MILTLVLLALEEVLGEVEEVLAVVDGDLVGALVQRVKVELSFFAHARHGLVVGEHLNQLFSLLLEVSLDLAGLDLVCADELRPDLVLEGLALSTDVFLQDVEEKMRVQEGTEFLDLLERVHFYRFNK